MNKKIMYIFTLFIIATLSMNIFSAVDFDDIQIQEGDTVWLITDDNGNYWIEIDRQSEVLGDAQDGGGQEGDQGTNQASDGQNTNQGDTQTADTQTNTSASNATNSSSGNKSSFDFSNMTMGNTSSGNSSFDFSNMTGGNRSSINITDIINRLKEMRKDNSTNTTANNTTDAKVADVPKVVSSKNYSPVSSSSVEKISQHIVKRTRDNKIVSEGDTLRLEGINKLYDSEFTSGHLLVYLDGKLVFNEITSGDLSTPILGITDDLVGQHVMSVEFTPDGDSNLNKYTENVTIV